MTTPCTPAFFEEELPQALIIEDDNYCSPESSAHDAIETELGEAIMTEGPNSQVIAIEAPAE